MAAKNKTTRPKGSTSGGTPGGAKPKKPKNPKPTPRKK